MRVCRIILLAILFAPAASAYAGDGFGRFFTTPAERAYLDQIREKKMVQQPVVDVPKMELSRKKKPVEQNVPVDAIKLKGLVYRKDGKSTAWINEGNSYEGDVGSQYTRVNTGKIKPDQVSIDFSGSSSEIKLRVGQSYLPAKKAVRDVIGSQNDKQ
jgi:hypothetical protein